MAIHFTFIASFVMPRKISYQHQWEELKNSHLGVSITSNVITSNDITSIVITSNDLFVMCSIAEFFLDQTTYWTIKRSCQAQCTQAINVKMGSGLRHSKGSATFLHRHFNGLLKS